MSLISQKNGLAVGILSASAVWYWIGADLVMPKELVGNQDLNGLAQTYIKGIIVVLSLPAAAAIWYSGSDSGRVARLLPLSRWFFILYATAFAIGLVILSTLKVHSFHAYADLANNLEILWRQTHGLGLTSPMFEEPHHGIHWFAAHFAPIAYFIAYPWFMWFPGTLILSIVIVVALLAASIPVILYARDRLGSEYGFMIGLAFLLYPTIQYIGLYEFGFLQLSIPFLAWAFYAIYRRWMLTYAFCIAFALIAREEVGFVVFMLGVYVFFVRKERVVGALTSVVGIAYSVIVIGVVIPSFRVEGGLLYQKHFQTFGETPGEVIKFIVTNPTVVLSYLLEPTRIGNFVMFFLPLQFLSFLSPGILMVALPNLATSFLAESVTVYSFMLYYLSPAIPFIFFSAIEGLRLVSRRFGTGRVVISFTVGSVVSSILFGPSPASVSFWNEDHRLGVFHSTNFHYSNYQVTEHWKLAEQVAAKVPRDAVVSAEQPFLPHLYDRARVYVFPTIRPDVEYVLFDRKHPLKTGFSETYLDFRARPEYYFGLIENSGGEWTLVTEVDGIRLFRRTNRLHAHERYQIAKG